MKARKSWGEDYICLKSWPTDAFLQCGDNGLVVGKKSYTTAFFEAFPKNPSTFIRGEGLNLELAEADAFCKYERIMACPQHEYKRRNDSEHGACIHCNLFTSHCFSPINSCNICRKTHVNYGYKDNNLCREHFIEAIEQVQKNYSIDDDYAEDSRSESEIDHYYIEKMLFTQYALKHEIIDLSKHEYLENNRLNDLQNEFYIFCRSEFLAIYQERKAQEKEFKLSAMMFRKILGHLFLVPALYESLFKKYFKLDDFDIKSDMLSFFNKMFDRYKRPV